MPTLSSSRTLTALALVAALAIPACGGADAGDLFGSSDSASSGSKSSGSSSKGTGGGASTGTAGTAGTGGNGGSTSGSGGSLAGTGGSGGSLTTGTGGTTAATGTGGATSSTTASTGTVTMATSSSSGGGPENCLDGVDNDGNGKVDCADPACSADYECVDAAPTNWTGPDLVKTGASATPGCPDDFTAEQLSANPADPAACTSCSCGDAQGVACSSPPISCWSGSNDCSNGIGTTNAGWTDALKNGACDKPTNLLGIHNQLSCEVTSASQLTSGGTCKPSAVDFSNKASFKSHLDACRVTAVGGGCGAGKVCVPKVQTGGNTNESVCVRRDGDQTCPSGWTTQMKGYTGADDTRACTSCACGAPASSCQGGSYTFYDADNCGAGATVAVTSNTCTDVSSVLSNGQWSVKETLPVGKGSCQPSGGAPVGSVTPTGPVTYCCK